MVKSYYKYISIDHNSVLYCRNNTQYRNLHIRGLADGAKWNQNK